MLYSDAQSFPTIQISRPTILMLTPNSARFMFPDIVRHQRLADLSGVQVLAGLRVFTRAPFFLDQFQHDRLHAALADSCIVTLSFCH